MSASTIGSDSSRHVGEDVADYLRRVRGALDEMPNVGDDWRLLHRFLGARRLLAPTWQSQHGGLALPRVAECLLLEELGLRGLPDTLWITTVQVTGAAILASGNTRLQDEILPRIAAGECIASALFSEHAAGSDIASISTTGTRGPNDVLAVTGHKAWSIGTQQADLGLCAFKEASVLDASYEQFSLCLIDLSSPGVTIRPIGTWQVDGFNEIFLDGVEVADDRVLAKGAQAWGSMLAAIEAERSGFDYLARAQRWSRENSPVLETDAGSLLRLRLRGCRLLALHEASHAEEGGTTLGALVKLATSEIAQDVIAFAAQEAWRSRSIEWGDDQRDAFREAPGLTVSAGASEVLIDLLSNEMSTVQLVCGRCHTIETGVEAAAAELAVATSPRTIEESLREAGLLSLAEHVDDGGLGLSEWVHLAVLRGLGRAIQPFHSLSIPDGPAELLRDEWRSMCLASYLAGLAHVAWVLSVEHAESRIIQGEPLTRKQLTADKLVRSLIQIRALNELLDDAMWRASETDASHLAVLAYETVSRVSSQLMQLQGARGLTTLSSAGVIRERMQEAWVGA